MAVYNNKDSLVAPASGETRGVYQHNPRASTRGSTRSEVDWRDLVRPTVSVTLSPQELCELHLCELIQVDSPSIADWRSYYRSFLADFGDLPIREHATIIWEAWLRARNLDPVKLAPKTLARKLTMASSLYTLAVREGALDRNPIYDLPAHVRPKRRVVDPLAAARMVLRAQDIAEIISTARDEQSGDFFALLLYCASMLLGVRVGELIALRRSDYSPVGAASLATVRVKVQWHTKTQSIRVPKDKLMRLIPVHPALDELIALVPKRFYAHTQRLPGAGEPLFPFFPRRRSGRMSTEVRRWNQRTALKYWKTAQLNGLVPKSSDGVRTIHSLRHTFITRLHAAGAHPLSIRALTHPASVQANARDAHSHYAHVELEALCEAISMIDLTKEVRGPEQLELRPVGTNDEAT